MVPDVEAAKEFYSGLFGWEYDEGAEEFGNYLTATLNGDAVAGMGPGPGSWRATAKLDDLLGG